ncbi:MULTISPECIES: PhoH family protein [unclassified Fusibacter]|uniref:PhoH family protein n=1 Tax=unclassified Fusibacter TaxID=2624464 RepID=UPI001010ACCD|nr:MULTISPECIES: PhoH family protein [unclassified Fusibacter]MCK8058106.1 PhoH family protein [Fusibacter sp. A2]NPE20688.1 PhoH family protein [Fusibacter sp. A1]RXV62894.1 phosphate starvation-inducible protein PhoH [Fusibacter sp. A1]
MEKTRYITVENLDTLYMLFGNLDEHAKLIEERFHVKMTSRDSQIVISGLDSGVAMTEDLLSVLIRRIASGDVIDKQALQYAMSLVKDYKSEAVLDLADGAVCMTSKGRLIKAKTLGQSEYVKAMETHEVVFGVGPAGTGKTFLAVAMAIRAFKNKEVERIVITRPAIEAGESLGFLPGDLQQKIDPYLRPLYDALYEILGMESYLKFKERGLIEVVPLAYMRGRTLDNAFIILDEAQNTTKAQMKMFLTRFGFGSRVVVNGDMTQVDLASNKESGLVHALKVLKNVKEISLHEFSGKDVVRHDLVKKIISAYDVVENS